MLDELNGKLRDKFSFTDGEIEDINNLFELSFLNVKVNQKIAVSRDPKDNYLINLAVQVNADYIITNDNDLLVLNPYENIFIVTLAVSWKILDEQKYPRSIYLS